MNILGKNKKKVILVDICMYLKHICTFLSTKVHAYLVFIKGVKFRDLL